MADLPMNILIKQVLDLLVTELVAMTPEEVGAALNIDVANNQELIDNIDASPKVIKEADGRWRWKSEYYVRNRSDLLALLRQSYNGIVKADLEKCYNGVTNDIKSIIEGRPPEVMVVRNSSNKDVLFPFDSRLYMPVSNDIKERWNAIRPPDSVGIYRYFVEHGLRNSANMSMPIDQIIRKRPHRREQTKRSRRVKLTNTHMEGTGIDLTQDDVVVDGVKKESAFNV